MRALSRSSCRGASCAAARKASRGVSRFADLAPILLLFDDPDIAELQWVAVTLQFQGARRALLTKGAAGWAWDLEVIEDLHAVVPACDPCVLDDLQARTDHMPAQRRGD